ncbi:MAG: CDP-glycerol glycerophosphotransferase family protein, partial [Bacteroidales bacterium]|nr:CDP-glycerol glycerophosphotransferase family protein [Bacteroidales bacterium]
MAKFFRNILSLIDFIKSAILLVVDYNKYRKGLTIAFSMNNPVYESFYEPIYSSLKNNKEYNYICFGKSLFGLKSFSKFFQFFFPFDLIILCADSDKFYVKKKNHVRVQIFHAIAQFGSSWGTSFLERFDTVFMTSQDMKQQLLNEKPYCDIVRQNSIRLYEIGYPKLDVFVKDNENVVKINNKSKPVIFYGPTWHIQFSSIFKWLDDVIQESKRLDAELLIKLHPFLLKKSDYASSGKINWKNEIAKRCRLAGIQYQLISNDIS